MCADRRRSEGRRLEQQPVLQRERRQKRHNEQAALQAGIVSQRTALLRLATVSAAVGLGATSIYDRIRAGTFPAPVRLSKRCSRWTAGSVLDWIDLQTREVR